MEMLMTKKEREMEMPMMEKARKEVRKRSDDDAPARSATLH